MTPTKGYTEMKDSGIEWVGMIPKHWTTIANKYVMHKEKRICDKWDGQDVLSLTMNGVIIRDILNPVGKMPTTFDGYQFAYAGELLMCLFDIDVTPRCVGRVFNDGVTSPAYSCFQLHDNADLGYFYYYYLMVDNTKELLHLAKNLRHSFTEEQLGQLKVPLPPLQEQSAIAAYLDTQCSKIDEIIAQAKASIEDYKQWKVSIIHKVVTKGMGNNRPMKDSGILWIKKIPESWSVRKLKFAIFPLERPVLNTDEVITCFRDGEVTLRKNRRTDGFTVSFTEHGYQGVEKGDLVIHGMDAFAGAIGCSDCRGKTTPVVHVCKTIGNNRYFMYALRNMALSNVFTDFSNGVRIRSSDLRNFSKLGDFLIAIPPITEQGEIVDYLDSMTSKIDMLVTEKQRLLDDLESYKKSLIYEVVTGKRRV